MNQPATTTGTAIQGADWQHLDLEQLQKVLQASPEGLTQAEALRRLALYGPNAIPERRVNRFLKLLSYGWGPIPWMIELAVILSALVRHWADFWIILTLLVANALVGFWEENQAGNAVAALKARLALRARVHRDGVWTSLAARELVPGDVVHLRLGEIVPADARLLGEGALEVDQSALTGESLPAAIGAGQAIFSGSIVRQGEADALVYGTGAHTYFGVTARLMQEKPVVSHFQKAVLSIGNVLIVLAVVLVSLILVVAVLHGDRLDTTLEFCLVLTVAAIPVAMPTVLSVTMAVGARLLSTKGAIVSRLAAIEELAGVDVLCSDKTGTLTKNQLSLGEPFVCGGGPAEAVLLAAALASRRENDDTIDGAVLDGLADPAALDGFQVLAFQPFDPVHKRTEASIEGPGGERFRVAKGAPQAILALVSEAEGSGPGMRQAVDAFAARGFRSLAVARTDPEGHWQLLGVLPLFDPPRDDSKATIATANRMGVKVLMVTGDQQAIARETASQLGLGDRILAAGVFGDADHAEDGALDGLIESADGFAQVIPEHKFHIVERLQKLGHIVGMTGDGVNDAPALHRADCGIAVSGATDAARAAASIVLVSPGLSVIIEAIKESRKIFQRMTSYAIYRIAETLRVLLFMTLSILVFNFYPITAVMIVLLALLNDGAILSIAYDRVHYSDDPEAWDLRTVLGVAGTLGLMGLVESFLLLYLGEAVFSLDRSLIPSIMYLKLSVAGHLTIFVTRTRGPFWTIRPARVLWLAVLGTQLLATFIAVYGVFMAPVGWGIALAIWLYCLFWFLVEDRMKLLAYALLRCRRPARGA